jgi:hypothetical protein
MSKIAFLPTGYESPKTSNFYMKFQEGENKFRILSQPIIGWEDWQDKKPIRYKFNDRPAFPIDPKKPIKHFWSMIVWNYALEEIQILHLTQSGIRKSLETLCRDEDWGAPYFYDLKVMKKGEGMETEYSLNPLPHKPLAPHIQDMFNDRRCNLEALFYNEDPFSKEHTTFTPGIFSQNDVILSANNMTSKISMEQAYDLNMILEECEEKYKKWVYDTILKQYKTENLCDLPADIYERMRTAAVRNMEENRSRQSPQPQMLLEGIQ